MVHLVQLVGRQAVLLDPGATRTRAVDSVKETLASETRSKPFNPLKVAAVATILMGRY